MFLEGREGSEILLHVFRFTDDQRRRNLLFRDCLQHRRWHEQVEHDRLRLQLAQNRFRYFVIELVLVLALPSLSLHLAQFDAEGDMRQTERLEEGVAVARDHEGDEGLGDLGTYREGDRGEAAQVPQPDAVDRLEQYRGRSSHVC